MSEISTYFDEGKGIRLKISSLEGPPFLKEYLNYLLVVENLSPHTVGTYYLQLRLFLRWLLIRDQPGKVTKEQFKAVSIGNISFTLVEKIEASDVYAFLAFAQNHLGNGPSSRALKLRALSSFFRYHVEFTRQMDHYPTAVVPSPRTGKRIPKYLEKKECIRLLNAIEGNEVERDFCMITFLVNIGMRLSELVGIDMKDVRDDTLRLRGKGDKERMVYLNDSCLYALEQWLTVRSLVKDQEKLDPLFISRRTKCRLSPRRVEQIVEKALLLSGLSDAGYTTHTLRHTAATLMYQEGGVDILVLQEILGHSSPSTTRIYTHLNSEQVRSAMQASPLSGIKRESGLAERDQKC